MKSEYPRIEQLGIKITDNEYCPGISCGELDAGLDRAGLSREKFGKLFGVQTCGQNGLYPWDVEAVLERMMSGRLTGTQAYWD